MHQAIDLKLMSKSENQILLGVVNKNGSIPIENIPSQEPSKGQKGEKSNGQEPTWVEPFPATSP